MDADEENISQSDFLPSSVGFIVLESQPEQTSDDVDIMQQWPALVPQETNDDEQILSSPKIQEVEEKIHIHGLVSDISEDEQKRKDPVVLATDSEYEGLEKRKSQSVVNFSSDEEEVLSESEEQGEVTVIEKNKKDKKTKRKDEEKSESDNGGSSFHSTGRENLGSYNQAELSQDHCRGNRFNIFGSLSQKDMFIDDENEGDVSTPSEYIGNLQLSNQPMIVPETVDESDNYIPPSQDCYGSAPVIIPSSPTDGSFQDLSSEEQDKTIYNPSDTATLAEDLPHPQSSLRVEQEKREEPSQAREDIQKNNEKKETPDQSASHEPGKISTVSSEYDLPPESLHLHYTETQLSTSEEGNGKQPQSSGKQSQGQRSSPPVAIVTKDVNQEDVIIIENTAEEEEMGDSQQLLLRLTPTQSGKSQNLVTRSPTGETGKQKEFLDKLEVGANTVKSQEVKSGNTHSYDQVKFLSQPAKLIGKGVQFGGKVSSTNSESNSAEFHLSLPKDGQLLHPVTEVSPPMLPSKCTKVTARGDSQEAGPSHAFPRYLSEDEQSQTATLQQKTPSLRIGMITTQSEMSDPSFQFEKPEFQEESTEMAEDPKLDVFRRTKTTVKMSPRKKMIEEDSDEDIRTQPPKKKQKQEVIESDTAEVDDTEPVLDDKVDNKGQQQALQSQVNRSGHLRKALSVSSESSQQASVLGLQTKTSISSEGGYLASVDDDSLGITAHSQQHTQQNKDEVTDSVMLVDTEPYGSVDIINVSVLSDIPKDSRHSEHIIISEESQQDEVKRSSTGKCQSESKERSKNRSEYTPKKDQSQGKHTREVRDEGSEQEVDLTGAFSIGSRTSQTSNVDKNCPSERGTREEEIPKGSTTPKKGDSNDSWLNTRGKTTGEAFQAKNVNVMPVRDTTLSGKRHSAVDVESPVQTARVPSSSDLRENPPQPGLRSQMEETEKDNISTAALRKEPSDPYAFHGTQSQRLSPDSAGQRSKGTRMPQQPIIQTPVSSRKKKKSLSHRKLGVRSKRKEKHPGHVSFESPVAKTTVPPALQEQSRTPQDKTISQSTRSKFSSARPSVSHARTSNTEQLDVTSVRERSLAKETVPQGVTTQVSLISTPQASLISTPQVSSISTVHMSYTPQSTILRSPSIGQERSGLFKVPSTGHGQTVPLSDTYTPILERGLSFEQSPGSAQGTKGDVTMLTVKVVEVRTEVLEVYRNGALMEKSEKEVQTENVEIYRNGKLIKENVNKSYKDPIVTKVVPESTDTQPPSPVTLSPSRTTSTCTSGDLGDISSLSKSSASTKSSVPSPSRSNSNIDASVEKANTDRKSSSLDVSAGRSSVSVAGLRTGASLDSAIAGLPSIHDKSTDHEFFTPPEQVHRPGISARSGRTPELQQKSSLSKRKSQETVQQKSANISATQKPQLRQKRSLESAHAISAATSRDTTIASDFENSPNEASSINKTGSAVGSRFVISVEGRRSSESLFTTSPEAPKGGADEETGKSASKTSDQKDTSGSSDAIECAQRATKDPVTDVSENAGEDSSKHKSRSSDEVSPQVPFQDVPPISSPEHVRGDVVRSDPVMGARVMAKWKDGFFYPGTITKVENTRFQVKFDDGDTRYVKQVDLLLVERLPIGQPIMVQSEDGYFDRGIITKQTRRGGVVQYTVEKDNGLTGEFRYSQVILSEDQAVCLVSDTQCTITSPRQPGIEAKLADVTLENLVEGKRRKGSRYEQKDVVTIIQEKEEEKSRSTEEAAKEKKVSSARGRKRKLSAIEPQATSTPTPKEKGKRKRTRAGDSTPVFGDIVESPIGPRRSPRKSRVGLFEKEKTPMPASKELFKGIVFLLTYVVKSSEQKKEEKLFLRDSSSLEGSTDESASEYDVTIPFDKDVIRSQIEAGGGTYLEQYNEKSMKAAKQCLLISDSYQRTIKYFQCLASAIPCISHLWIRDSCIQGRRLDYKSYTLQAGISLQKKKIMEWSDRRGNLRDLTVMVVSDQAKFKDEWSSVLEIAGCNVVSRLPSNRSGESSVNVIVADKSCPARVLTQSKQHTIPVVSSEWVIQSLVNGQRMAYSGHPRYKHDYYDK